MYPTMGDYIGAFPDTAGKTFGQTKTRITAKGCNLLAGYLSRCTNKCGIKISLINLVFAGLE